MPAPPDYGGVIDVYYKIKALAAAGAEIYLHCFLYGDRKEAEILNSLCKEVWYYPRRTGFRGISPLYPYNVFSRRSEALLERLQAIDAPILFEQIHSTFYLKHPALSARYKMVRVHNIEHEYFDGLGNRERSFLKREYFRLEAGMMRSYEQGLSAAAAFVTLTPEDSIFFQKHYPAARHECIRGFHPFQDVTALTGAGDYCLYHGNLGHPENEEAVIFLLEQVFNQLDIPLIIAGKGPSARVSALAAALPNCSVVADPDEAVLTGLIQKAQIHVLPTFQATGLKLKLLYALFAGRHVLVSPQMLHSSGLADCCHIAPDAAAFRDQIKALMPQPFTQEMIGARRAVLALDYNNAANAQRFLTLLPH